MDVPATMLVVVVLIVIFAAAFLWTTYNKLQHANQEVKEKGSNIQIALSKKISLINQLIGVVKNYGEYEQFTNFRISSDTGAAGMAAAYRESTTTLMAIQAAAQRFPQLKADSQYGRLVDSIQACENNIQTYRLMYNNVVKTYNLICLSVPTVFVARTLGFPPASYLEFDTSGLAKENSLRDFKTDDGERLNRFLGPANGGVANAGKSPVHAGRAAEDASARPTPTSLLNCLRCGNPVEAFEKFCGTCGNPLKD